MRIEVHRFSGLLALWLLLVATAAAAAGRWVPATAGAPAVVTVQGKDKAAQEYLAQRLRESQRNMRWVLWGVLSLVALLIVYMAVVMYRKKNSLKQAENEKDAAMIAMQESQFELEKFRASQKRKRTTPDLLLEGETPEGEMIAIKLSGELLGRREGLIIGRNPAMSTYILDHPEVSRRHFRLVAVSDQLMIEDLGSTNGVSLDGQPIAANQLEVVMPDTEIALGDLRLYLRKAG